MTMRTIRLVLSALLLASAVPAAVAATPDAGVKKQLDALGLHYKVDDDGDFDVVFDVDEAGKRTQIAYVRSTVETYGSLRVREIWSPGYRIPDGKLSAAIGNRLLEASHEAKLGAWTRQGGYAVYVVQLPADADAKALQDAVEVAVRSADEMEAELTPGKDEF